MNTSGIDAVVVIRGGGARSELAVFDAEEIALAIADSPVPVLTGLGHETDRSVADEVAHLSLKTPTACAGALIGRVREFAARAERTWSGVSVRARHDLDVVGGSLDGVAERVAARTRAVAERADERLALHARRVPMAARSTLDAATATLDRGAARLGPSARRHADTAAARLDGMDDRARLLDPALTLARGWSITRTEAGALVRSGDGALPGTVLVTTVAQGTVISRVEDR